MQLHHYTWEPGRQAQEATTNCPSTHSCQLGNLWHRTCLTTPAARYKTRLTIARAAASHWHCTATEPETVWQPQQDLDPQLDWPTEVEMEQVPLAARSPVRRSIRSNMVVTSRFKDYDVSNLHTHEGKCDICAQPESAIHTLPITKL